MQAQVRPRRAQSEGCHTHLRIAHITDIRKDAREAEKELADQDVDEDVDASGGFSQPTKIVVSILADAVLTVILSSVEKGSVDSRQLFERPFRVFRVCCDPQSL